MIYRKGQIVPRRLVRCKSQKTQYMIKFGADVEIKGRSIQMLSDGCALTIEGKGYIGGNKGKPRLYIRALLKDLHVTGYAPISGT